VVVIPSGRYVITQMLEITQSNVMVKGAGVGKTTLYFPKSLKRLYGEHLPSRPYPLPASLHACIPACLHARMPIRGHLLVWWDAGSCRGAKRCWKQTQAANACAMPPCFLAACCLLPPTTRLPLRLAG